MSEKIKNIIAASIQTKQAMLENDTMIQTLEACSNIITTAFRNGNKVLFCGNGGSSRMDAWGAGIGFCAVCDIDMSAANGVPLCSRSVPAMNIFRKKRIRYSLA